MGSPTKIDTTLSTISKYVKTFETNELTLNWMENPRFNSGNNTISPAKFGRSPPCRTTFLPSIVWLYHPLAYSSGESELKPDGRENIFSTEEAVKIRLLVEESPLFRSI